MLTTNYNIDERIVENVIAREATSQKIDSLLTEYLQQFEPEYTNATHKEHVNLFIRGLLSNLDRKTIEPVALILKGPSAVRGLQNFFSRSPFNTTGVLHKYQTMVADTIGTESGMISIDESDFVKKGNTSPGVARQYCGRLGKTENCQAGVFAAYSSDEGHGLLDSRLYIPQKWFGDDFTERRRKAQIPDDIHFQSKNQMAAGMIQSIINNTHIKAKWVGCDSSFGSDHAFLDSIPDSMVYFAGVRKNEKVYMSMPEMINLEHAGQGGKRRLHPSFTHVYVESIVNNETIPWKRVPLADSAKGMIYADTKCIRCVSTRVSMSGASGNTRLTVPGSEIWLYIRKHLNDEIKYFVSNAPSDTTREELDKACIMRWPIEQCFEECKSYLGMSHYETQVYCAWERHMLFVMMAHFFTTLLRLSLKKKSAI